MGTHGYSKGLNYMVDIDEHGRLRWVRNGQLVETSRKWKDAGNGEGIVLAETSGTTNTRNVSATNALGQGQRPDLQKVNECWLFPHSIY